MEVFGINNNNYVRLQGFFEKNFFKKYVLYLHNLQFNIFFLSNFIFILHTYYCISYQRLRD